MHAANRVRVEQRTDYFLVRFGFSTSKDLSDEGEEVASVMLPLTVATTAAVELFEGVYKATADVTSFFGTLQTRIDKLNAMSGKGTTATAGKPGGKK